MCTHGDPSGNFNSTFNKQKVFFILSNHFFWKNWGMYFTVKYNIGFVGPSYFLRLRVMFDLSTLNVSISASHVRWGEGWGTAASNHLQGRHRESPKAMRTSRRLTATRGGGVANDWRWLWGGGIGGDPGQNGHTPKWPHPKRPQNILLPKRPHCIWLKRPQRKDHYQNGHIAFGQKGHRGRITTKTATLHFVKRATEGGSLPKRPHCILAKSHGGMFTTKTATL